MKCLVAQEMLAIGQGRCRLPDPVRYEDMLLHWRHGNCDECGTFLVKPLQTPEQTSWNRAWDQILEHGIPGILHSAAERQALLVAMTEPLIRAPTKKAKKVAVQGSSQDEDDDDL